MRVDQHVNTNMHVCMYVCGVILHNKKHCTCDNVLWYKQLVGSKQHIMCIYSRHKGSLESLEKIYHMQLHGTHGVVLRRL